MSVWPCMGTPSLAQKPFHACPVDVRSKTLQSFRQLSPAPPPKKNQNSFPNPYPKRPRQSGDPCFCVSNRQLRQCPLGCLDGLSLALPGSLSLLLHCEKIMARNLIWSQCPLPGVISASKCELRMLRRWAYSTVERAVYDLCPPVRHSVFQATEQKHHKQGPQVLLYSSPPRIKSKATKYQGTEPYAVDHAPIPSPRDAAPSGVWQIYGTTTGGRQGIHWVLGSIAGSQGSTLATSSSSSGSGGAGSREM